MKPIVIACLVTSMAALVVSVGALQRTAPSSDGQVELRAALDKVTANLAELRAAPPGPSVALTPQGSQRKQISHLDYPSSSPGYTLAKYINAQTWQERLPFVKQSKGIEERMATLYGTKPISIAVDQLSIPDVSGVRPRDIITASALTHGKNIFGADVVTNRDYFLEKTADGWTILWEPSVRWRPLSWEALKASRPTEPLEYLLYCKLADSYFAHKGDIKSTHYCLQIGTEGDHLDNVYAFVPKESPAGRKVYETLKNGKVHGMVLAIQFEAGSAESCVWVSSVVSDRPYIYDPTMAKKYTAPTLRKKFQNAVGWEPFLSSRTTEPTDLLLYCSMGATYSYSQTKEAVSHTHYSIDVRPNASGSSFTGFVMRDTPAGQKLFESLKDGKVHPMVLTVQFRDDHNDKCVWITRVLSDKEFVYDEKMKSVCTAPVLAPADTTAKQPATLPFRVSNIQGRWAVDANVLGGQPLVVPEVRLRVEAIALPINNLTIKVVYFEKTTNGFEILYEDTSTVVSSSDTPLAKGLSKTIISKSGKGYQAKGAVAAILLKDASAELYFDVGQGFVKFETIPIAKKLAD